MKKILFILLFFLFIFCLCAENNKSVTIKHIGSQNVIFPTIVINTWKQGMKLDWNPFFSNYFIVQESTLDEIINLIDNNKILFGEREWMPEYNVFKIYDSGTFELFIENEEVTYYYYLIERQLSAIFFNMLYVFMEETEKNNIFINELNSLFRYFRFEEYIFDSGNDLE